MKSGFAIVVGKCIDMQPDSFTGRDGDEVKKLSVLVKPGEDAAPIELEVWGDLATKFEADEPVTCNMIIQTGLVGREWETKKGDTFRKTSLRIKEWTILDDSSSPTKVAETEAPF